MRRNIFFVSLLFISGVFLNCAVNEPVRIEENKSSSKTLTGFYFANPDAIGTVVETSHIVSVTVPYGTDTSSLTPSVFHTGAGISPSSGQAVDFSNPVVYTVTAADGSTQAYTVTVNTAISSSKTITSFSLASPAAAGVINQSAHLITVTVPYGTDIASLSPSVAHSGSSLTPASGTAQDFTDPVTYTVTAVDGSAQNYTVLVSVSSQSDKALTGFYFINPAVSGIINEGDHTVAITVPFGTDITSLSPIMTHNGAGISPASGAPGDFTNPVSYTVTAADGSKQVYAVTVTIAAGNTKEITSFGFTGPATTGVISESNHSISVTVPYGTDITALSPSITHTGASVNPVSGAVKDYTNPVVYTVTAANGTVQTYTVSVTVTASSAKAITAFDFSSPATTGTINETAHTVSLTVIPGTVVTALVPSITHTGASVTPASGTARNFTNPVTYTVRAADGSIQAYSASVIVSAPSNVSNPAAAAGFAKVVLSWNPPADINFTGVEIVATPAITPVTVPKGMNMAEISGLTPGTNYSFTVRSVVSNGDKSSGVTVSATPLDACNVLYYGNFNLSGTVPVDSGTYTIGDTITVLPNSGNLASIPAAGTAEAYKFGGWNTKPDGTGTTYAAGTDTISVTDMQTVILYAKWVKFEVRDTGPAGGRIFYDKGSFSDGWRYMEAAPSDCPQKIWGDTRYQLGADAEAIGTGKSNTAIIVAAGTDCAARACDRLTVTNNGVTYDDWYLPSRLEAKQMHTNLHAFGVGGFSETTYWTSSEVYAQFGEFLRFFDGTWGYISKTGGQISRASRQF